MRYSPVVFLAMFLTLTIGFAMSHGLAEAQTLTTLHAFANQGDGATPLGGLIFDSQGNLYGSTTGDFVAASGTVFEMTRTLGKGWTLTTLYTFQGGSDGAVPGSNLLRDAPGNLFGVTVYGGSTNCTNGCGTVFELSPGGHGGWQKTEVWQFQGGNDGYFPAHSLIADGAGNLYGTTDFGGGICPQNNGCGTVFELSPAVGGGWTKTILHVFGQGLDGVVPQSGLVFDAKGNLYGTASFGGIRGGTCPSSDGCGVVYELSPSATGGWTEKILHAFTGGLDGAYPYSTPAFDRAGNLFGTTYLGGANNNGVVFEMRARGGRWNERVIQNFSGTDGGAPFSGVVVDAAGDLFGTTLDGGTSCLSGGNCGVAYKMTPNGTGWQYSLLHSFTGSHDGQNPNAIILDKSGRVFGTTSVDGVDGLGTVFEITP
jgi:uncharacterized repeat protein (TIGR03803 family)